MIAYKFRMYPKKEQQEKLDLALEVCRQTYNYLLEGLNERFTKNELQNYILDLKVINPKMRDVHSKVLQMENQKLFSNLASLSELKKKGHKVGRLRFKGRNWFKTFTFNQSGFELTSLKAKKGILWLSKIGNIPVKLHRQVEGKIKNIVVKKSLGKWYCSIITNAVISRTHGEKELGIDLGIENYIMDSEHNSTAHPHLIDEYSKKMKREQQSLFRKKKGSNNRKKARIRVAKLHEKITNSRNDFLHKLSAKYVGNCKAIAYEDLNIKGMMESSYNAKNIADASWGRFIQFLGYKAESAGCRLIAVNPKNTTKMCSRCGAIKEMPIWERVYKCPCCGLEIERDYNSALDIKQLGFGLTGKELACAEIISHTQAIEQEIAMKQEATSLTRGEASC